MEDNIFAKIIRKELPADIVYEDDKCLCFKDIHPVAPCHLLLIPKKDISQLSKIDEEVDHSILGHLLATVTKIAKLQDLEDYRVVINNGAGAGQTVFHLHLHIIGKRALNWPPG